MIHKQLLPLLLGCTCTALSVQAQGLTLLTTAGGLASSNDLHLSYSIGEPCITNVQNGSVWVTEGFQQPGHIKIMVSTHASASPSDMLVYPNPASTEITLSGSALDRCFEMHLSNVLGQVIMTRQLLQKEIQLIALADLQPGLYVLTIHCTDRQYISQSIIKI